MKFLLWTIVLSIPFSIVNAELFERDSTSTMPCGSSGTILWGDFDNDADLDIFVAGVEDIWRNMKTTLYRNDGDGKFSKVSTTIEDAGYCSAAWKDFNNDGYIDLLFSGETGDLSRFRKLYKNEMGREFTELENILPQTTTHYYTNWVNYNNDTMIDIVLANEKQSEVFVNLGNNFFMQSNAAISGYIIDADFIDFDKDGDQDMAAFIKYDKSDNRRIEIFEIDSLDYKVVWSYPQPCIYATVNWSDLNSDGYPDLVFSCQEEGTNEKYYAFAQNKSGKRFELGRLDSGRFGPICDGDINNDGDIDLIMASDSVTIFINQQDYSFTKSTITLPENHTCQNAALGDYDNDGDLDLALVVVERITVDKPWKTEFFASVWLYANTTERVNDPPNAPQNLISQIKPDSLVIQWDSAEDDNTPTPTLSYNVSIENAGNDRRILSPMSLRPTGFRLVPELGNTEHNTTKSVYGLLSGEYKVAVQSIDNAYLGSPFSETIKAIVPPLRPLISFPPENSAQTFPITMGWTCKDSIEIFNVQLSLFESFETIVFDTSLTDTFMTISRTLTDTTYYWRLAGQNKFGRSAWSNTSSFIILPNAPKLVAPIDGAVLRDTLVVFSWQEYLGAKRYHIQIASDPEFNKIIGAGRLVDLTLSQRFSSAPAIYFWHVQAILDTTETQWSETRSFSIDYSSNVELPQLVLPSQTIKFFPNPFNEEIRIHVQSARASHLVLQIYNSVGQQVAKIWNNPISQGMNTFSWNGRTKDGRPSPSGVYFAIVNLNGNIAQHKIVLLR